MNEWKSLFRVGYAFDWQWKLHITQMNKRIFNEMIMIKSLKAISVDANLYMIKWMNYIKIHKLMNGWICHSVSSKQVTMVEHSKLINVYNIIIDTSTSCLKCCENYTFSALCGTWSLVMNHFSLFF